MQLAEISYLHDSDKSLELLEPLLKLDLAKSTPGVNFSREGL